MSFQHRIRHFLTALTPSKAQTEHAAEDLAKADRRRKEQADQERENTLAREHAALEEKMAEQETGNGVQQC